MGKWFVSIVLVGACTAPSTPSNNLNAPAGDPNDPSESLGNSEQQYVSGSRIRARVGVTDDGAKQFLGWRDSQLSLDCTFSDPGDGQKRCLPSAALVQFFADVGCTQPLARVPSCSVPDYLMTAPQYTCPTTAYAYYERGTELVSPATIYTSNCQPSDVTNSLYRYFRLGNAAPLTNFAAVSVEIE